MLFVRSYSLDLEGEASCHIVLNSADPKRMQC